MTNENYVNNIQRLFTEFELMEVKYAGFFNYIH